jgi:hypothetical protein
MIALKVKGNLALKLSLFFLFSLTDNIKNNMAGISLLLMISGTQEHGKLSSLHY